MKIAERKRRLAELYAQWDAEPNVDDRTPDEIIDYNEYGHFD